MQKEKEFTEDLDNLFDIAHSNALNMIKSEEDKQFLINQRQRGRVGCFGSIDRKVIMKEKRSQERKDKEIKRKIQYEEQITLPSTSASISLASDESDAESNIAEQDLNYTEQSEQSESSSPPTVKKKRSRINFITPKLVGSLDRCQLSVRDSVYVLHAVAEALGHNTDDLVINRSSIHRCRQILRAERAKIIKSKFQEAPPNYVVAHWDGKLLPSLNVRDSSIEHLPIIVSSQNMEQLLGVSKLERSTGEEIATAVYNTLENWGVSESLEALCCDTTASNTGRLNGAMVLIEQKFNKDLLYLPCRHHIYELILRSVFECKLPQVTSSPYIPLFKKFQKNWNNINNTNYESGMEDSECYSTLKDVKEEILNFAQYQLQNEHFRHDYNELLELVIIFLNGDLERRFKIHPPGAMHQARWMSRAIYCLKIYIFRNEYTISSVENNSLRDICIFIIRFYVQAWFGCPLPHKAPCQDLDFIKSLKSYENIDPTISKAAIKKLCGHLWYLSEEAAALAFFDDTVPIETKQFMVKALQNEGTINPMKRFTILPKDIDHNFTGMFQFFDFKFIFTILIVIEP